MPDLFSIEVWRNLFTRHGTKIVWGITIFFGLSLVISFGTMPYTGRGQNGAASGSRDSVVATVNGEPITQQDYAMMAQNSRLRSATPGPMYAQAEGEILNNLVTSVVVQQEAKKHNVRASDADIDRALQEERDRVMPKGSADGDWEQRVEDMHGMTLQDYREFLARQFLGLALFNSLKDAEKVTDTEVKNQTTEVKLSFLLIPTGASPLMPLPKGRKPLSDAEAKKKAEDLLAKAKAGGDIAALARENSADFNAKKGGDLGYRPEYKSMQGMPPTMGVLGYGKDFDEAIHKTPTGQFTDVVPITGFEKGYGFAKVTDRKNTLPKDFDSKKATEELKTLRAQDKFRDMIKGALASAQVVFKDPDKKPYYDMAKYSQSQQQMMMAQMGQGDTKGVPTQAELDKQKQAVDAGFEDLLKRHPDDTSAALIVAANLKAKLPTSPAERAQINDRLIALYESALKSTENRDVRFDLASLYRDKKQDDKATAQYAEIAKLLEADPPYDSTTMQSALEVHQKLQAGFAAVNKTAEAEKEKAAIAQLKTQIAEEQKKQADAQKAAKATATSGGVNLPGGAGTLSTSPPTGGTPPPSGAANSKAPVPENSAKKPGGAGR